MFGSIIIRKSLPQTAELDVGLIAECLIFYEKVHVIADISMLRLLTRKIGLETIEELIKNNSFKLSFSPFITGTRVQAEFTPQECFDFCSIIKVGGRDREPDYEALFFEALEKGSGKRGKSRRIGNRLFPEIEIIAYDKIVPIDKGIPEIARRDLDNRILTKSAIKTAIEHFAPTFQFPQEWEFRVVRHKSGFNIFTNINFDHLNESKSKDYFPGPKSKLTRAFLLDTLLKANEDLFLSAYFNSELVTKSITSSIISLKCADIINRSQKNINIQELFQKTVITNAKTVREAINAGEKSFKDLLPLIERSEKFKTWLKSQDRDVNLIKEYYHSVTDETWIQKLPAKILRFSIFTGTGIFADSMITGGLGTVIGVASAAVDNFLLDRFYEGWKPNQYIDEIERLLT